MVGFAPAALNPPYEFRFPKTSGGSFMDEKPVLVDLREGYRVVTLNRPQRLNAFNEAMHVALAAALEEAEADDSCRAVLLTGAGRGFCAGQALTDPRAAGQTAALRAA